MPHPHSPSRAKLLGTALLLALAAACDAGSKAPITGAAATGPLRSRADSAAAFQRSQALWRSGARGSLSAADAGGIPVLAGQRLVVTVTGAESSRCEDVSVTGAIAELVLHEVGGCYGNPNYGIGKTATTSPAAADGTVSVIMSTGAGGTGLTQVTGAYPDYTVALDDGIYDADYNDVVLSVHVDGGSKLRVSCTAVTRGEQTLCTASSADGSAFTVKDWKFEAQGHTVSRVSSLRTWGGEMAVGGTVTVNATIGGRTETAAAQVVVNPRKWPDVIPAVEQSSPDCTVFSETCPVLYPPTYSGHLGKASLFFEIHGRATNVQRGPNAGWSYVLPSGNRAAAVTFPRRVTFLNPVLSRPADPWYASQGDCTAPVLLAWVSAHEAVHQAAFEKNADGRINALVEGIARFEPAHQLHQQLSVEAKAGGSLNRAVTDAVLVAGDGNHTDPSFGPAPCAWNLVNGEPPTS